MIDIASYADDSTPYCTSNIRDDVKATLKVASIKVFQWFYNNGMKANVDKCHFLSSLDIASTMKIGSFTIQNSASQKLLGITIDRHLNFNEHVSNLCKTASLKITVLARVFTYITLKQKRTLMKAYFMSQFGYCPLVWINNRINTLHERALRLAYNDFTSSFT